MEKEKWYEVREDCKIHSLYFSKQWKIISKKKGAYGVRVVVSDRYENVLTLNEEIFNSNVKEVE